MITNSTFYREAGRIILQLYRHHDYNRLTFPIDKVNEEYLKKCGATVEIEDINKVFRVSADDYMKTYHLDETENQWLEKIIKILQNDTTIFRSYVEDIKNEVEQAQQRFMSVWKIKLLKQSHPLIKSEDLRVLEAFRRLGLFIDWILQGEEKDASNLLDLLRYSTFSVFKEGLTNG